MCFFFFSSCFFCFFFRSPAKCGGVFVRRRLFSLVPIVLCMYVVVFVLIFLYMPIDRILRPALPLLPSSINAVIYVVCGKLVRFTLLFAFALLCFLLSFFILHRPPLSCTPTWFIMLFTGTNKLGSVTYCFNLIFM